MSRGKYNPRTDIYPLAKLQPHEVREIRQLREHKFSSKWISRNYGLSITGIVRLLEGETYKNVT